MLNFGTLGPSLLEDLRGVERNNHVIEATVFCMKIPLAEHELCMDQAIFSLCQTNGVAS